MSKLLFVDTNIYLDFYRIRNEVKVPFLSHLEAIKDRLIMTDQVEMEFKKNRQNAILEGMAELKYPNRISVPGVIKQDKSSQALNRDVERIKGRIDKLKTRLENVLERPTVYDQVYKVLQRLFAKKKDIDLYRKSKKRYEIRELAKKRFILGYPPRKKNDTSIGDAVNWEWMIHIAKEKNVDIWIVSRDSDYGVTFKSRGFINDWLRQEFKERVNKRRNIILCPMLSQALKEFEIPVTIEEEKEEERVVELVGEINAVSSACATPLLSKNE
ncbi:PIN domain-containing protein [Deferrisoma palaeochoriense]